MSHHNQFLLSICSPFLLRRPRSIPHTTDLLQSKFVNWKNCSVHRESSNQCDSESSKEIPGTMLLHNSLAYGPHAQIAKGCIQRCRLYPTFNDIDWVNDRPGNTSGAASRKSRCKPSVGVGKNRGGSTRLIEQFLSFSRQEKAIGPIFQEIVGREVESCDVSEKKNS